jgi:2-methylcitrate dehydratase PrpD
VCNINKSDEQQRQEQDKIECMRLWISTAAAAASALHHENENILNALSLHSIGSSEIVERETT